MYFQGVNAEGLKNKTLGFNSQLRESNHPLALNDTELGHFSHLMVFLSDVSGNQKKKLNSMEMDVVGKLLQWPREQCLPVLDLLRVFLTHHQSERLFSGVDSGMT